MPQEYIITRIKDPDNGNVHWIRDLSAYHESDKGVANGIAELDSNGKVPSSQLPSYVDDVEEYADIAHFPVVGESGKVYIALDTNISYRWGGSTYVKIGSDLSLGETASTAYRGDRGAAAYAAAVTNVETVPTENSGNLITSGAVYAGLDGKADRTDTVLDTTLSRGRKENTTVGAGSFAFGNNVEASESYAHAEGVSTVASGIQSHAEGYETVSSGENAHAEGEDTNASGDQAHAEGISTIAFGDNSHTEGNMTTASGENAHAEGASVTASGENAHAEGEATEASGENAHAEGVETVASNDAAHAEGGYSVASGVYAHAEGYTTSATGAESHAEGYSTTASGRFSHAEGSSVTASGESAHAEGSNVISQGANAHAEGSETQALGESAHAEGIGGRYTDGNGTLRVSSALGKADHTEGYQTSANSGSSRYNYGAHAEGYRTIASNVAAHSEGSLTQATGANSHAEGNSSKAVASQAHAEGTSTYALGDNSHAEGRNSTASGANSHAEGVSTIANHASQHVSGEFNVADPSSASTTQRGVYAEIIGNGASDASRSNARTLDWDGNERLMGDVYVGCKSDGTGGMKLAKITDVPSEQALSAKADKVQSAVSGNFASLDSEGNLVDSGHKHSDYLTEHQDISGKLDASEKGAANGVAELDNAGKVPASQLPSYVDDVLEYEDLAHFPVTGESGKVYIALDTNITYRWGGSTYVAIGSDLALGETSSTAYRGDRGKIAYDHATDIGKLTTAQNSGLYKIATTSEGHIASVSAVQKSDITVLGIPAQDTTYSDFGGADGTNAGTSGLVPAPAATDNTKYLKGDGTWADVDALPAVTSSDNGKSLEVVDSVWAVGNEKIDKNYEYEPGLSGELLIKAWINPGSTSDFVGRAVWTDGTDIYISNNGYNRVFDKSTSTWSVKTWTGLNNFNGNYVWTDGEDTYFSNGSSQYVLDKSTSTWSAKTWAGLTSFIGRYVWTDGENIYYSSGTNQYVLDKSISTWTTKTWTGLNNFSGNYVWTDGEDIYFSNGSSSQYVLDKATSTWSAKTWAGTTSIYGTYIWTDGENIYYSSGTNQYALDKSTSKWNIKTWTGLRSFEGDNVWTDGEDYYYSSSDSQYVFAKNDRMILYGERGILKPVSVDDENIPFAHKENTVLLTTLSMGRASSTTIGKNSTALGYNVSASGDYSHAEGSSVSAHGNSSHAEGNSTQATGISSHAEGNSTQAAGNYSHVEGYSSNRTSSSYGARGKADHAEGYNTLADSGSSSSAYAAHAEGNSTKATAPSAHAEGHYTTASSNASHAEGYYAIASGPYSHAEGYQAKASGGRSHAEGDSTVASGMYSHAEGYLTNATGSNAHAEGISTTALGYASHAEGYSTYANGDYQHTFGNSNYNAKLKPITITSEGASEYIPGKTYRAFSCYFKVESGGTVTYYVPHSDVNGYVHPAYDVYHAGSYFWGTTSAVENAPEWDKNTTYESGVTVKCTDVTSDTVGYYISKQRVTENSYYPLTNTVLFHTQPVDSSVFPGVSDFIETVGNGTNGKVRSNARALDWDGNERLMGDLYVGCNADSTGGTKVAKISDIPSYSDFTGATAQADGVHGFVPAPLIADKDKFLKGDGTWSNCFINGYSVSGNVLTFY